MGIRLESRTKDLERVWLDEVRRRVIRAVEEKTSWESMSLEESRALDSKVANNEW